MKQPAQKKRARRGLPAWARRLALGLAVTAAGSGSTAGLLNGQEAHGVYVRLLDAPSGSLTAVMDGLRAAAGGAGFQVLAEERAGVNSDRCSFGASVLTLHDPGYAAALLAADPLGAFAMALRIAVFEDEDGVHAALANPLSLNRTVLNDKDDGGAGVGMVERLRSVAVSAGVGTVAHGEYGQVRSVGLIGKTMGIMAGGPFPDKVDEIARIPGEEVGGLAGAAARLAAVEPGGGSWKWRMRGVYEVVLPDRRVAVVGMTGERMEREAFDIVGEGSDKARASYACPGIDHAPAFPVELVLTEEGGDIRVLLVDEMFRMKMYFEDAGKTKFAMNMRMPGSIEDEIRDKVEEALR